MILFLKYSPIILIAPALIFTAITPRENYETYSSSFLFIVLMMLVSGSFMNLNNCDKRKLSTYLDPSFYFTISFALYCGLGALNITGSSAIIIRNDVYYFYNIFIIFFLLGCYTAKIIASKIKKNRTELEFFSPKKAKILLFIILSIGLIGQTIILFKNHLIIFGPDFQTARTNTIDIVGGYVYYISLSLIDFIILSFIYILSYKKYPFPKVLTILFITISLLLLLLLGSRTRFIYPIAVSIIFYMFYMDLRINKFKRVIFIFILLIGYLVLFGSWRYASSEGIDFIEALPRIYQGEIRLPSTALHMILTHVPFPIDYFGFDVITMPLLTVLPGKDEVIVNILKTALGLSYKGGGFTPSLVGSLYIMHGTGTVIIGSFLYGLIMKYLYTLAMQKGLLHKLIYSYLLVYSLNSIKGGLFKDIEPLWHMFILTCFVIFTLRGGVRLFPKIKW